MHMFPGPIQKEVRAWIRSDPLVLSDSIVINEHIDLITGAGERPEIAMKQWKALGANFDSPQQAFFAGEVIVAAQIMHAANDTREITGKPYHQEVLGEAINLATNTIVIAPLAPVSRFLGDIVVTPSEARQALAVIKNWVQSRTTE